ncbi:MAG: DUF3108 domain-containing protein [Proteobacteria bacterium]|nr:DUF3108 domain-containing protein [Pseudomonadota bacterium]
MTMAAALCKSGLVAATVALALPDARAASPPAETRATIYYSISMVGVPIGQITWAIDLSPRAYQASASGKASGALSILVNGEGRVATQGTIDGEAVAPTFFSSNVTDDGETTGLQMTFENGSVKTLRADEPTDKSKRIPVRDEDKMHVTDPLSAMLIAAPEGEPPLSPARCERTLPVFDGQRRYDLILSFKRMDRIKLDRGYAGPVLVCAVVLRPIAGYRPDSVLVKYVGGRPGMEIWFMPIAGTPIIAPGRLKMPTGIGTLEIEADKIDWTMARPMAPAPTGPQAPGRQPQ